METRQTEQSLLQSSMLAQQFLMGQRQPGGFWTDFKTLAGFSNEWVSGYVGSVLAKYGDHNAHIVASDTLRRLLRSRFLLKGWGYNHKVPPDADSTLWVCKLAQQLQAENHWRVRRAKSFLNKHVDGKGSVHTYYNSYAIRLFTKLHKTNVSFDGWCGAHTCVTAAFANINHDRTKDALDYLQQQQQTAGYWKAHWWTDNEYATALAAEALHGRGTENDLAACEQAIKWVETGNNTRSPFVAALVIRILLCTEKPDYMLAESLSAYLMRVQQKDGSWEASAFLRIPPTYITDPENYHSWVENTGGGGSFQRDYGRLFTTATVLAALEELRQRISGI